MELDDRIMEDIPRRISELFSIRRDRDFRRTVPAAIAETARAEHCLVLHRSRFIEDTDRLCTVRIDTGRRRGLILALERTAPDTPPFSPEERAALHFMGELISDESRRRSGGSRETGTVLNPREREVADLVLRGFTNREAAARLGITEATVKRHLYNIFNKTGVDSRTALLRVLRETAAG